MIINKIRLWLSRNDFRILLTIIFILIIYFLLDGLGDYNNKGEEQSNENTYLQNAEKVNESSEKNFSELDTSSEEYQKIVLVVGKMINCIYQANVSSDNVSLRQDIYNMFSNETIQKFLNDGNSVNVDSILNFIFYVDNVSDYAIGKVYKCNENNNVAEYAIVLRYKKDERFPVDSYLVINMDYNNNTFSYDGMVSELNDIDSSKELSEIENKGSNSF